MPVFTVLYDADCGFCDWSRRQVLASDTQNQFRFLDIRSEEAAGVARSYGHEIDQTNIETIYLAEPDGSWTEKSRACGRICKQLGYPWKMLAWLIAITPRPLADFGYNLTARYRHQLGRLVGERACKLP